LSLHCPLSVRTGSINPRFTAAPHQARCLPMQKRADADTCRCAAWPLGTVPELPVRIIKRRRLMMTTHRFLLSLIFPVLVAACSSTAGVEVSYRFIGRDSYDAITDIYRYEYSVEGGEMKKLDIYVKQDKQQYLLTMGSNVGNIHNRFFYNESEIRNNLYSESRSEKYTVTSLKEAIEQAMLVWIDDTQNTNPPDGAVQ
jgi:hypothetical protein